MVDSFGTLLRERRHKAGRNQGWLAAQVGLDVSYISKLENNRMPPPAADTIVALCRALECECVDLLTCAGKLSPTVQQIVATNPIAQALLLEAEQLRLSDDEWATMRQMLHTLRGASPEGSENRAENAL